MNQREQNGIKQAQNAVDDHQKSAELPNRNPGLGIVLTKGMPRRHTHQNHSSHEHNVEDNQVGVIKRHHKKLLFSLGVY